MCMDRSHNRGTWFILLRALISLMKIIKHWQIYRANHSFGRRSMFLNCDLLNRWQVIFSRDNRLRHGLNHPHPSADTVCWSHSYLPALLVLFKPSLELLDVSGSTWSDTGSWKKGSVFRMGLNYHHQQEEGWMNGFKMSIKPFFMLQHSPYHHNIVLCLKPLYSYSPIYSPTMSTIEEELWIQVSSSIISRLTLRKLLFHVGAGYTPA